MEESIKKAEELIEATTTALARIQYESSFDDFSSILGGIKHGDNKKVHNWVLDDVRRVLSPRERTFQPDNSFSLNKKPIRDDEINSKIEAYRQEFLEREPSKAMVFDVPVTRVTSETNLSQRTVTKINLTEDLKAKLQETQDVVNRGIQTARELTETVEVLRSSRRPKTDRREVLSSYKSESVSSGKTIDGKRCKRCNAEITRKTAKEKDRRKEDNVLVTLVTRMESSSPKRKSHNLNYQQLPSLKIQGDLSCQTIPSVDIPPGKREWFPNRTNTAYETYSHEELVSDKIDKIIDNIKASNGFVRSDDGKRLKSVECSNCGKVVRVSDKSVRIEQIDELLKMCDYNVFDPRIDDFVERYTGKVPEEAKYTQTEVETAVDVARTVEVALEESPKRRIRLRDLSSELTRKYRDNATELESDHLEFEGILRELFEKMDESRALFKSCEYLKTIAEAGKRKASLSVTPPVLLSYTGSGEEADDGRNAVLRPNRTQKSKLPLKTIRKKLERKELEINYKLISSSCPAKGRVIHSESSPKPTKTLLPVPKPVSDVETSLSDRESPKKKTVKPKSTKPPSPPRVQAAKPSSPVVSPEESKRSPPPEVNLHDVEESVKQTNGASDYESDFEEESFEEKSPEPQGDDNSYKYNTRLSTITEVESELDRKINNLATTPEESDSKKEMPKADDPKPGSSSSDEDDTRRLLRNVNRDLREVVSHQLTSQAETPEKVSSGVAEPLKEVLIALKNQFERTELLADRLTESIKEVNEVKKPEDGQEIPLINGHRDLVMVNNLQRARKMTENGNVSSPRSKLLRTLREKESAPKEIQSGSVSSKGSTSPGKYSEGEISEQEMDLPSDRSSPSIGEVINEHSNGSLSEEKSVIKFL